jgi:Fungal chitosanase of glycosyl hydrolase group 75
MKSAWEIVLVAILLPYITVGRSLSSPSTCDKIMLFEEHGVTVWSTRNHPPGIFYKSGLAVDADGAFRAYHPSDRLGLDSLAHAGHPGNWWALVTDNEKRTGRPVVQGESDPAPGFYVSTTALYDPNNLNVRDPHRYVDAATIPYVVLHPKSLHYGRLGDFATVVNLENGKISAAVVADESAPNLPVGEGSIALAKALGISSSPRYGGKDGNVAYLVYPHSGNGRPRELQEITARSRERFEAWGGLDKLKACLAGG